MTDHSHLALVVAIYVALLLALVSLPYWIIT